MSSSRSRGERLHRIRSIRTPGSDDTQSTVSSTAADAPPPPPPQHPSKHHHRQQQQPRFTVDPLPQSRRMRSHHPTLDPYVGKLERYELFCTNQSYYLVGCNKLNTAYRVLKMDRTLIERPLEHGHGNTTTSSSSPRGYAQQQQQPQQSQQQPTQVNPSASNASSTSDPQAAADAAHNAKPTLRPLSEFLTEDPNVYSQEEIHDMLDMIHDGNRLRREDRADGQGGGGGGLKPIAKAYGIVGFIRFLDCYYLTLITRRAKVGSIGGNGIYTIKNTETFPIKPAERMPGSAPDMDIHADPSSVLLSMWNRGKRSVGLGLTNREIAELRYQGLYQVVDLTKNFFFSYTYDLTRSLQENFLSTSSQPFPPPPFKDMFAWNFFLTRELEGCASSLSSFQWVMPIVHGAFVQRKLNDYGRSLNVTLLARRSRHFAGTRYLKRGVSEQGKVANDVEHEQIIHDESASVFSAYLQVRGSIPTFWTQESSVTMPKPPIELNRVDPTYTATQSHFEDLLKRYGSPIVVLDLVKQSEKREREVRVGNEYRHAIDYINTSIDDDHKIRYCALDYSHISKHRHLDVSTSLNECSTWAVNQTGFFCSSPRWKIMEGGSIEPFTEHDLNASSVLSEQFGVPVFPMEQTGVLRTNCIDCLDRTNVAQFSAGVETMGQQLVVMGIRSNPKLDPSSNIVRVLIDMYVDIGDHIALQYGGSEAHKKVSSERSESIAGPIGKHKELLTSIRRYYSNAFTDRLKQDAMNLFLGYYLPFRHTIPLWEMETDYYLHNFHVKAGRGTIQSMKSYQIAFGVADWKDDDELETFTDQGSAISGTHRRTHSRQHSRSMTLGSLDTNFEAAMLRQEDQSARIQRVRDRCEAQNQSLSTWWKIAIQGNVQQRMWMQLGRSPGESELPPRFERLYQPGKMAQFDRFFARPWATPVRRSHAAQHNHDSDDEGEIAEFRRNISGRPRLPNSEDKPNTQLEGEVSTLDEFVTDHGFAPRGEPSLKMFLEHHDAQDHQISRSDTILSDNLYDKFSSHVYIGGSDSERAAPIRKEYFDYVKPQEELSSSPFRPVAFEEFKSALHTLSLSVDDVKGIRELAESAHVGRNIRSGPYSGLQHNVSAIEVATVLQEQLYAYENMRKRGELRQENIELMDSELDRRGFCTDGLREEIKYRWDDHLSAEKSYSEAFLEKHSHYKRSDLTTDTSLKLYSSFFAPDDALNIADYTFLLGEPPAGAMSTKEKPADGRSNKNGMANHQSQKSKPSFEKRAARLGISITSHADLLKSKSPPLFPFERRKSIPAGFEMINEELFARKDNKFMVLNGAGMDSWSGTSPRTKISGIESMLIGTLG